MNLKRLAERLVQRLKNDPSYHLSTELTTGDLLGIFWRRGWALWRGMLWRPRLGSCQWPLFVGHRVQINHARRLHVGRSVTLEDDVRIDALSCDGIRLGNNVSIARFTVIEATGVISDLGQGFAIGDNSNLGDYNFVGAAGGVRIGNNVLIGQHVSFHSENHVFASVDVPMKEQGITRRGITIEDDCWLGAGSIFLDGVTVGKGSVIAAGSVVTHDVPPLTIVAGVPAKVIRQR
jgi:acetyltransferase-like isoleucine patch superfamily enzyme